MGRGGPCTISALVLALSVSLLAGACGHAQARHAQAPPLTIDVLDVGQGDAVLVRSPDRLRPRVVVIGVGAGNPYGHPHDEALELYRRAGAHILRTDRDGSVRIEAWATGETRVTHPHPHP